MPGGSRLIWIVFLLFVSLALVWAQDGTSAVASPTAAPPKTRADSVEETIHGHKIADPYRWLENTESADTQQYVREQLAYTRSILDPLPGRDKIHQRLTELLSIGTIGTPQLGGKFVFYIRREGTQNQPVLYVREGVRGKDRVLVDVNQMAADGT